jgi:hypothetical protein
MKYLLRDGASSFTEKEGEPLDSYKLPLRPWAITQGGRVVFSEWKTTLAPPTGGLLQAYDKQMSLRRRRQFETLLAGDANRHPECVKPGVDKVTHGALDYASQDTVSAGKAIKARCYGDTASGRLGTSRDVPTKPEDAWSAAVSALRGTDIPKILGIQACLANFLTRSVPLSSGQKIVYDDTANKVAPKSGYLYQWFNSDAHRGRVKRDGAEATKAIGIATPGFVTQSGDGESRKRGIDEWDRVEDSNFIRAIDMRNISFGAGRSGTTGELLKTYRTFAGLDTGEDFKQYLLAIVIYLVTGGHHSCHEIFSVANLLTGPDGPQAKGVSHSASELARGAYVPGKYIKHLPDSYTTSISFQVLKEMYYDIAMLGHLHGTFS